MVSRTELASLLDQVASWAEHRPDIRAVALVGSHARGQATALSDIDLIVIAEKPARLLADTRWADTFGHVVRHRLEEYGRVTSLRVVYRNGPEVEFGVTDASWAGAPLDEGTARIIDGCMRVVFEREPLLSVLADADASAMRHPREQAEAEPILDAEPLTARETPAPIAPDAPALAELAPPKPARAEPAPQPAVPAADETLEDRVRRVTAERIEIVDYDPDWPARFEEERRRLIACLPADLLGRIEHVGSTAVPGLSAKPIVDMLVEVADLEEAKERIVPVLEARGYDYFWSPTHGDDVPPWYAFFIRRDPATGERTHHIHMVEPDFVEHWEWLLFRDYLIDYADVARDYEALKHALAAEYPNDRVGYTEGKAAFIGAVTEMAAHERDAADAQIDPWDDMADVP
jgi:GrpB-like predicted nucleotidyltransferase (UPF0157 family)/predicted nucleotidyltransferase